MSFDEIVSDNNIYWGDKFPYYKGIETIYKLLDKDLAKAIKTTNEIFNEAYFGKEIMNQSEEAAYKKGYYTGTEETHNNYNQVNSANDYSPKVNYAAKTPQKDSRMSGIQAIDLRCEYCNRTLFPVRGSLGIYFEHGKEKDCDNRGKYIFVSYDSLKTESD